MIRMKRDWVLTVILVVLLSAGPPAASRAQAGADPRLKVYQYRVSVGQSQAYLWIPPDCETIRAVIIALDNLTERRWLEDPVIRKRRPEKGLELSG